MFDCTLTEVEVWADDASNFRTRWRFYNRMKERKVDAAARQPLVLSKKIFFAQCDAIEREWQFWRVLRRLVKNIYFTVRLTVRGWGSAPSALTVSKFENFDPFVQWNMTLGYSKHILSHCEGSQKCLLRLCYTAI